MPDQPIPAEEERAGATPAPQRPGLRHILKDLVRPSRGQLVVALILGLTAMGVVTTIRSQGEQGEFSSMRRSDLLQLLDNLTAETRRLETEVRELSATRDRLESGAEGARAAQQEAERRLQNLQILAGTIPAQGPGIRIVVEDPQGKVTAEVLLNAVEELRDAGAEVIEFNDTVRVVASTWLVTDRDGRVMADGQVLNPDGAPISIEAIGDPATLEAGAQFRGGLVSEIEGPRIEGRVSITRVGELTIDSLATPRDNEYARPR